MHSSSLSDILKYIDNTPRIPNNTRYELCACEIEEIMDDLDQLNPKDKRIMSTAYDAVCIAFLLGRARGYRAALNHYKKSR